MDIVDRFIIIGHHHRHTSYERIRVPGSTVPLEFGTGKDHGYLAGKIYEDKAKDFLDFKPVEPVEPFLVFDIDGMTDKEFDALLDRMRKIRRRTHCSFVYSEKDVRVAQLSLLGKELDAPVLSFKKVAAIGEKEAVEDVLNWEYKILPLTRNELPDLLISRGVWEEGEESVARNLLTTITAEVGDD